MAAPPPRPTRRPTSQAPTAAAAPGSAPPAPTRAAPVAPAGLPPAGSGVRPARPTRPTKAASAAPKQVAAKSSSLRPAIAVRPDEKLQTEPPTPAIQPAASSASSLVAAAPGSGVPTAAPPATSPAASSGAPSAASATPASELSRSSRPVFSGSSSATPSASLAAAAAEPSGSSRPVFGAPLGSSGTPLLVRLRPKVRAKPPAARTEPSAPSTSSTAPSAASATSVPRVRPTRAPTVADTLEATPQGVAAHAGAAEGFDGEDDVEDCSANAGGRVVARNCRGVLRSFNVRRGFGFISPVLSAPTGALENAEAGLWFFGASGLPEGEESLGSVVSFDVQTKQSGSALQAFNVAVDADQTGAAATGRNAGRAGDDSVKSVRDVVCWRNGRTPEAIPDLEENAICVSRVPADWSAEKFFRSFEAFGQVLGAGILPESSASSAGGSVSGASLSGFVLFEDPQCVEIATRGSRVMLRAEGDTSPATVETARFQFCDQYTQDAVRNLLSLLGAKPMAATAQRPATASASAISAPGALATPAAGVLAMQPAAYPAPPPPPPAAAAAPAPARAPTVTVPKAKAKAPPNPAASAAAVGAPAPSPASASLPGAASSSCSSASASAPGPAAPAESSAKPATGTSRVSAAAAAAAKAAEEIERRLAIENKASSGAVGAASGEAAAKAADSKSATTAEQGRGKLADGNASAEKGSQVAKTKKQQVPPMGPGGMPMPPMPMGFPGMPPMAFPPPIPMPFGMWPGACGCGGFMPVPPPWACGLMPPPGPWNNGFEEPPRKKHKKEKK